MNRLHRAVRAPFSLNIVRRVTLTVTAVALSAGWGAPTVRAQEVTFLYNPPDGTAYTHMGKQTSSQDIAGKGQTILVTTRRDQGLIHKTTSRIRTTNTLVSVSATMNGKPFTNPAIGAEKNIPVTIEIDFTGKVTKIEGLDQVLPKILSALKKANMASLAATINEDTLREQLMEEWNRRVVHLFGRKAAPGQTWTHSDTLLLTGAQASAPAQTRVTYVENVKCGDAECAHLRLSTVADPDTLKPILEDVVGQGMQRLSTPAPQFTLYDAKATQDEDYILEPATLLMRGVKSRSSLSANLEVNGVTIPLLFTERSEGTYTYGADQPPLPKAAPSKKPAPKPVRKAVRGRRR